MVENICVRFGHILYNDVFLFATFLDPYCGPNSIPSHIRDNVILRLKENLLKCKNTFLRQNLNDKKHTNDFRGRFKRCHQETSECESFESIINNTISDHVTFVKNLSLDKDQTVLDIWRENENFRCSRDKLSWSRENV